MVREKIDLKQVCQRYKARIIRIIPKDGYYLLETNRGTKELRIWPRIDVMRWSHAWREQLARQGFRGVERFIRTRDSKPYVVLAKKGFTLTDHVPNAEPFLPSVEQASTCGNVIAMMHLAQQSNTILPAVEVLNNEQEGAFAEVKRARHLLQEFISYRPHFTATDKWIAGLFPPLIERLGRSAELLATAQPEDEWINVSHRELAIENWEGKNQSLFLHGFYQPVLSIQQRDTASFLKELYSKSDDFARVDAFLDSYEAVKPLRYEEYVLLVGFLAYPEEAWRSVESYVVAFLTAREKPEAERIEAAIQRQTHIDALLDHVARRAERARSETTDEQV